MNFKLMQVNVIGNTSKLWIKMGIWTVASILLLIINYYYFNHNTILVLFCIGCLWLPWIFFHKMMGKKYIEKIVIKLEYDLLSFTITKNEIENSYKLCDIKSYYTLIAGGGNSIRLSFKFKDANKIFFNIPFKNLSDDQTNTEEVINSFRLMIKNYNKTLNENQRIRIGWWMKGGGF
jgi:hypothetical protein